MDSGSIPSDQRRIQDQLYLIRGGFGINFYQFFQRNENKQIPVALNTSTVKETFQRCKQRVKLPEILLLKSETKEITFDINPCATIAKAIVVSAENENPSSSIISDTNLTQLKLKK